MTAQRDGSQIPTFTVDELVAAVLDHPTALERIADRIAGIVSDRLLPQLTATDKPIAEFIDEPESVGEATQRFIDLVQSRRPTLITGDPRVWGTKVVAAAGGADDAVHGFEWALSAACPTSYWRELASPITAPRETRGSRSGPVNQLLAEWRAASKYPAASARIDEVVGGVVQALTKVRGRTSEQKSVVARRNALDLLKSHDWAADRIVQVVTWGVRSRPHWRNTLVGVPAPRTYDKIHGDWVIDGNDFASVDDAILEQADYLVTGWSCYYAKRINAPSILCGDTSRRNAVDCLRGSDGAGPIPRDELKKLVLWLCDAKNDKAQYFVNGSNEFPPIKTVRRALVAMTSPASTAAPRVMTTNRSASGAVHSTDVSEV